MKYPFFTPALSSTIRRQSLASLAVVCLTAQGGGAGLGMAGPAGSEEQGSCVQSLRGGSKVGENVIVFELFSGISKLIPVN